MVRRSTWILLGVFALLVGFAWLFQRYQANKSSNVATATPTTAPVTLYSFPIAEVNNINITDSAGNSIDLYRDSSSSNWAITDVPVDQADTFQIESIGAELLSLQIQETLTQSVPLDSFGLVTPAYTITMTTSGGTQLVTYVGSPTVIGDGYYIRVDSGPVVILDKVAMDDVLNLLKNPPLLPTATLEVTPTETGTPIAPVSQATPSP
jgi:hypothetical protein